MEFKNGINADKSAYGQGIKFVNVMDIFRNNFLKKDNIAGRVRISDRQSSEYSVIHGDILFNRTSETREEIAYSTVYTDKQTVTFGGFVIRGRQKKNLLLPNFAGYCFKNETIRKEMIRRSQGAVRANIGQKDLNMIPILIPPKYEQEKIVQLLSKIDSAIEKAEALVTAKQKQFKWLLKQLMKDNERWKKVSLGKIGSIYTGLSGKSKQDFGHGKPYIPYLNIFNNFRIDPKNVDYVQIHDGEKQNFVYKGDVFFTVSSETPNDVGMASVLLDDMEECYLNSFCFGWRQKLNEVALQYLQYYLRSAFFRKQMARLAQGATRFNLSKSQLLKAYILYPTLSEQERIAHTLDTVQKEIYLLKQHAEKYTTQKRVLMQKLLVGKWRITNT